MVPSKYSGASSMMFRLLRIEFLKTRRSLALLMMLVCPLFVVLLTVGMQLKNVQKMPWQMYWLNNTAIWCYFMLPLFIALITALLNGNEHKNATWRLMLTLPISTRQLYLAKLILASFFVAGANLILLVLIAISIALFGFAGHSITGAFDYAALTSFAKLVTCSLPILVLQHWFSWRVQNIVAPLALGVISTMGIIQIGHSKDWIYYPWSYLTMAMQGSSTSMRQQALMLASVVGLSLMAVSVFWVGRKTAEFQ
jgi:hypothetical protein